MDFVIGLVLGLLCGIALGIWLEYINGKGTRDKAVMYYEMAEEKLREATVLIANQRQENAAFFAEVEKAIKDATEAELYRRRT